MENIANFIFDHYMLIVSCMFIMVLPVLILNKFNQRKAERNLNILAYYFKKYKLNNIQDAWKVANDPKTPYEGKQKIATFIEFYHKINKRN